MKTATADATTESLSLAGTVFWRDVPREVIEGESEFAVIDVETTGLFPARSDRIVEFAVIRVDANGNTGREYVTLVNPRRDIGPTWIHGITTREVRCAPTFDEIAGDILEQIQGAILVAHNVRFDKRFMLAEFGRMGCALPDIPAICTLGLSYRFLPHIGDRRLIGCCAECGIPLEQAHSALVDARAVAALFRLYLARLRDCGNRNAEPRGAELPSLPTSTIPWPSLPLSGRTVRRDEAQAMATADQTYISTVIARLPVNASCPMVGAYIENLDRILEDRRVTPEEANALYGVATEYGLDQAAARAANEHYLRSMVRVAYADGKLSVAERADLTEVAVLLGCQDVLDGVLRNEEIALHARASARLAEPRDTSHRVADDAGAGDSTKLAGKTVCFTGESRCRRNGTILTRATCQALAGNAGLIVTNSVTKALDILVVADPDSMSGKAEKARRYGTRIMAEPVFWQRLGVAIE